MKILIISTSVLPLGGKGYGGIEKLCYDFVEQLNSRGHQVSVCAPYGSIVPNGIQLLPTVKLPEEQDMDEKIGTLGINLDEFDIIHDFSHKHVLARYVQKPIISMLWDPIVNKYEKAPYNIVCLSNWQKERFERLYNQKAIVMPPLVNTDRYKPDPNAKRERFLFLGKISPEKGVHLAIEYARELKIPLDVVGGLIPSEQDSPYLKQILMIRDDCVAKGYDIRLHWNVNEEDKISFLQNAKAVIYPVQQDEAHWLVGVEAFACGIPAITFDRGALREVFYHGPTGYLAEKEKNFKWSIERWKEDMEDIWISMRTQTTKEKYGHENVIPLYEKLYQDVRDGKRW